MKIALMFLTVIFSNSYFIYGQGNIIAKKVMPSVVLIVAEDGNGQMLGLGSGFFISKNVVATNFHVIEGSSRGYIKLLNGQKKINIDGIVGVDKVHDLALLSVNYDSPLLFLGEFDSVEVGQNIYAVGNPKGLEGTFSQGIVSSIREMESEKVLQITAPISPGSSGGPVLNNKGEVIGVSVATYRDGQNLNFAVPSSYLKTLIKNKTELVSIKSISAPASSSVMKKIGDKITDGVIGGQLTWDHSYQGKYSFSVRNNLRENIYDLTIVVIFFDLQGNIIESKIVGYNNTVLSGLAKRVTDLDIDNSVQRLTSLKYPFSEKPEKFEIRIVDFKISE
jgi:S1-C subfamily serine protease